MLQKADILICYEHPEVKEISVGLESSLGQTPTKKPLKRCFYREAITNSSLLASYVLLTVNVSFSFLLFS